MNRKDNTLEGIGAFTVIILNFGQIMPSMKLR
jgi:hypothetical protein